LIFVEEPADNDLVLKRLDQLVNTKPGALVTAARVIALRDGTDVTIRPIGPGDAQIEQEFIQGLSARSRYFRFFSGIKQLSPYMLEIFTHQNFPRDWALIATIADAGVEIEIGVARFAPTEIANIAEFAIVVADEWQGKGVATRLMQELIAAAEVAGVKRLEGVVMCENVSMLKFVEELGFTKKRIVDDSTVVQVYLDLPGDDS
jgi:acetyltransferase